MSSDDSKEACDTEVFIRKEKLREIVKFHPTLDQIKGGAAFRILHGPVEILVK